MDHRLSEFRLLRTIMTDQHSTTWHVILNHRQQSTTGGCGRLVVVIVLSFHSTYVLSFRQRRLAGANYICLP